MAYEKTWHQHTPTHTRSMLWVFVRALPLAMQNASTRIHLSHDMKWWHPPPCLIRDLHRLRENQHV